MARPTKLQFCLILTLALIVTSYLAGLWVIEVQSRLVGSEYKYHIVLKFNLQDGSKHTKYAVTTQFESITEEKIINETDHVFPTHLTKQELAANFIPSMDTSKSYSCEKLIRGDRNEQRLVGMPHPRELSIQSKQYIEMTRNCDNFREKRTYTTFPLSQEEADFPIAYSILIFKDIEFFERLLRAIYRPQNYYCIHVDVKSSQDYKEAVKGIVSCFDNVFLTSRSIDVQWAYFSVLEPELICMEQLWKYKKWKYFINLTGQEFPLKTNWEIVQILKAMNGANNMDGTISRRNPIRTQYVHRGIMPTSKRKSKCPVPVTFTKGSVHIIAQRGYVDFVLHDERALKFRDWIKDSGVPDETFFTSLNYSPELGVPGAYTGEPETDKIDSSHPRNPFIARYKNWGDGPFNWPCGGFRKRQVCVFGIRDLKLLARRKELFANKFHSDFQTEAYDCMEELHYNRTRHELLHGPTIDINFYKNLDFVKNHV